MSEGMTKVQFTRCKKKDVPHRALLAFSIGEAAKADERLPVRTCLLDWLLRVLREETTKEPVLSHGAGVLSFYTPGPFVCLRSCIYLDPNDVSRVNVVVSVQSDGLSGEAMAALERAVACTVVRLPAASALAMLVDRASLREWLAENGGVAFVANGSKLTRNDDASAVVPFASPPSLEREFCLPLSGKTVRGMLIPKGVTVITGGGFHGKSTLLRALAMGCHDLLEGDGREWCVTAGATGTIRSEDGRSVSCVDISPFISNLPAACALDVTRFSTSCGSGSTSQAASVVEALEMGCSLLLLDEDTCASNFMLRDSRLRSLIEREPITPFIYRVNSLHAQLGVSTIVVTGGSADWFDVQDHTLQLDNYCCLDVTRRVAQISKTFCTGRVTYNGKGLVHQLPWTHALRRRVPNLAPFTLPPPPPGSARSEGFLLTASEDGSLLHYGASFSVDLAKLDQRIEGRAGALGIGVAFYWMGTLPSDDNRSLADILSLYDAQRCSHLLAHGLSALTGHETYVLPLVPTLGAAINRVRCAVFRIE